jgi:hypothetical protein
MDFTVYGQRVLTTDEWEALGRTHNKHVTIDSYGSISFVTPGNNNEEEYLLCEIEPITRTDSGWNEAIWDSGLAYDEQSNIQVIYNVGEVFEDIEDLLHAITTSCEGLVCDLQSDDQWWPRQPTLTIVEPIDPDALKATTPQAKSHERQLVAGVVLFVIGLAFLWLALPFNKDIPTPIALGIGLSSAAISIFLVKKGLG